MPSTQRQNGRAISVTLPNVYSDIPHIPEKFGDKSVNTEDDLIQRQYTYSISWIPTYIQ